MGYMGFLTIPLIVFAIVTVFASVKIVRQSQKGIVLRLGKYKEVINPGLNFVIPYIEQLIVVDVRECAQALLLQIVGEQCL